MSEFREFTLSVDAERRMKEINRERWQEAVDRLASIEGRLIALTGQHCGIDDNLRYLEARWGAITCTYCGHAASWEHHAPAGRQRLSRRHTCPHQG